MYVVNDQAEFDAALVAQDGRTIELNPGEYHYTGAPFLVPCTIRGGSPLTTRLVLDAPLAIPNASFFYRLALICDGGYINADNGAHSEFHSVWFTAGGEIGNQNHNKVTWETAKRAGVGVRVTEKGNADTTFSLKFFNCMWQFLNTGIDIDAGHAPRNFAVGWILDKPVFNGCAVGLNGTRIGNWTIRNATVQKHSQGVYLDGNDNKFYNCHWENGRVDLEITSRSWNNYVEIDSKKPPQILGAGNNTSLVRTTHRNMGRDVVFPTG